MNINLTSVEESKKAEQIQKLIQSLFPEYTVTVNPSRYATEAGKEKIKNYRKEYYEKNKEKEKAKRRERYQQEKERRDNIKKEKEYVKALDGKDKEIYNGYRNLAKKIIGKER